MLNFLGGSIETGLETANQVCFMRQVFGLMNLEKESLQSPCHQHICRGSAGVAEFCPFFGDLFFQLSFACSLAPRLKIV